MEIKSGVLMTYYCFDVGEEIDTNKLSSVAGKKAEKSMIVCTKLTPPYIQYKTPPLLIRLGKKKVSIAGKITECSVDSKIYGFGVITIRIAIPIKGSFNSVMEINKSVVANKAIREIAISYLKRLFSDIKDVIYTPQQKPEDEWEDYHMYIIHSLSKPVDAEKLIKEHGDKIAILLRSQKNLSRQETEDALKYRLSYYKNDITLLDWNSSFIYDPERSYDVPDIIEFAVIQLLELRVYDSMLDDAIEKAYTYIKKPKLLLTSISSTIKEIQKIRLDISETIDRLENYLKLIGDLYLAKVYSAASSRFYLEKWKSAVHSKLNIIEELYKEEWGRAQTNRMVIAEIAIVLLFVIDIVLILLKLI